MKVTEKERQPEAAEMVRNFRHMIEGENWAKILPEMPEQLLKRNFENLCHAAPAQPYAAAPQLGDLSDFEEIGTCDDVPF